MKRSVITGSGCYIPTGIKQNSDFLQQQFYTEEGNPVEAETAVVIHKFRKITGIAERRYIPGNLNNSDIAAEAGAVAIESAGIDRESLDLLIVAHNYGDVAEQSWQVDTVPSIANRVKYKLGIHNPACIAFDVLGGCPGWVLALMQADAFFKAGMAQKALVIGAETLSRVIDAHDRDSMIFSDGAGAVVLEYKESGDGGILAATAASHSVEEISFLRMAPSYKPGDDSGIKYMKMKGRKVYEYALKHVPLAMKACLEKAGVDVSEVKKIFLHQANEKMDDAIAHGFYKLYGMATPAGVMPMSIHWLGNSSVATIPTLYDLVVKGKDPEHSLYPGDLILFASVGAGMNISAVCYRCA